MADMWESTIKQLSKWGEVAADKSGFYFKKAVDKGEELTKLGRIQIEIEKIKREIRHHYTDLGKYIYQISGGSSAVDFTEDGEFKSYIDDISTLKSDLDERYAEKEKVRKENIYDEQSEKTEQTDQDSGDTEEKVSDEPEKS